MIGFMILKIITTAFIVFMAIVSAWYATKQKTASDGVFCFVVAMSLMLGITFMWV